MEYQSFSFLVHQYLNFIECNVRPGVSQNSVLDILNVAFKMLLHELWSYLICLNWYMKRPTQYNNYKINLVVWCHPSGVILSCMQYGASSWCDIIMHAIWCIKVVQCLSGGVMSLLKLWCDVFINVMKAELP